MNSITIFLDEYAELEHSVRNLMAMLFSDTCGLCTACCCRADICEEAIQSSFLNLLLKKQGLSASDMDDRIGWLDLTGCSLEYGKPPICYAYYCDQLLARLPDDETRYVTQVLGRLMYHTGRKALGEWHLVEIMNPEDLGKIELNTISKQLNEAKSAYEVVEHFVRAGRLTRSDRQILEQITTEDP